MSEPRDCRCPHCHCFIGTRNPDGICAACTKGECVGDPKLSEWQRRALAHGLPGKVYR